MFVIIPPHPTHPTPHPHSARVTCYFKTTTTCHTLQCNYNVYKYPAPPHPPRAWRVTNIRIMNILISRRVTYYLCALNIFVIHRRRSSAFAKKHRTQKMRRTPPKKGNCLEVATPLRGAQKTKKCLRTGRVRFAQIFKKNMSRKHAKHRVSRGYVILTYSLKWTRLDIYIYMKIN